MVHPKSEARGVLRAPRAKQTGMALEMDVIKKIGAQLERLTDQHGRYRVLNFVQHSVNTALVTQTSGYSQAGPPKQANMPLGNEFGLDQ